MSIGPVPTENTHALGTHKRGQVLAPLMPRTLVPPLSSIPPPSPAALTALTVERAYSQTSFETENATFRKICTPGWSSTIPHFPFYLYRIIDTRPERCRARQDSLSEGLKKMSLSCTNHAIKILNAYLMDPVRRAQQEPMDEVISRKLPLLFNGHLIPPMKTVSLELMDKWREGVIIEHRDGVMSQIYQCAIGCRASPGENIIPWIIIDSRKRIRNLISTFYEREFTEIVHWAKEKRIFEIVLESEVRQRLLEGQGEFVDALASELYRRSNATNFAPLL